jgi:hypothetical protein
VRWLEKTEISGNMLLKDLPISLKPKPLCKNWKRLFVDWFVVRKKLSHLFEIHFQLPGICISKTCVKQGNSEIRKLGLRDEFESPNL